MSAEYSITLEKFPQLMRELEASAKRIDYTPIMKTCGMLMQRSVRDNFSNGRSPAGIPWKPIKGLRVRGGNLPLRDRGLLLASITSNTAKGSTYKLTETSIRIGTNLAHMWVHQEGHTIYPKNAKALAVPRTIEAYRAGRPRDFPGKLDLIWPRGSTTGMLVEHAIKGKKKVPHRIIHYLLLPKAVIPARPFLGWNDKLAEDCEQTVADFVEKKLREI